MSKAKPDLAATGNLGEPARLHCTFWPDNFDPRSLTEMNSVAEIYGGYTNSTARAMIINSDLPERLWPYAIKTAAYIDNRLISEGDDQAGLPAGERPWE